MLCKMLCFSEKRSFKVEIFGTPVCSTSCSTKGGREPHFFAFWEKIKNPNFHWKSGFYVVLLFFAVVPPGNISKCVTYCVLVSLMFNPIRCSRIAHGYNSPFFTTLYRLFSTATKVVNFLDFSARKRGYNFVAAEPKYPTLCRASCRAVRQTTQARHLDTAAMCV